MRRIENRWNKSRLLVVIAIIVAGCGGGGGGDTGTQTITYSGSRSQAVLTDSSAETVAMEAYDGGETGSGITGLMDAAPVDGGGAAASMAVVASVSRAVNEAFPGGVPRYTESNSMDGSCGGNASYTATINDQTGNFSFAFVFNSYCEMDGLDERILNGSISFSGKINLATDEPENMTVIFTSLTSKLSDGSENVTLGGTISLTVSGATSITMTMNFVTKDNLTGKTYWVNNYVATVTDHGTYEEITISGRFYDHDEGYVEITTYQVLQVGPQDEHPYAGILQFDGADGNSVRLEFLDPATYQVTAELNGDDLFDDFDSGQRVWQ